MLFCIAGVGCLPSFEKSSYFGGRSRLFAPDCFDIELYNRRQAAYRITSKPRILFQPDATKCRRDSTWLSFSRLVFRKSTSIFKIPRGYLRFHPEFRKSTQNFKIPPGISRFHPEFQKSTWNFENPHGFSEIPGGILKFRVESRNSGWNLENPPGISKSV